MSIGTRPPSLHFQGIMEDVQAAKRKNPMSEISPKYNVTRNVQDFLAYHNFEAGDKTVEKGKVTQQYAWEANSVVLVSIENNTKRRTAVAHTTFFKHEDGLSVLADKQTVALNNEDDVENFIGVINEYMSQIPWRKSQSGADFFAALMRDGRQVRVFSLNKLL